MADIVNAGVILMVAAFGLVAIVGAADEVRERVGPASGLAEPDGSAATEKAPSVPDVTAQILPKHTGDDDRGGKHHDGRGHDGKDKDEKEEDDEEEDEDDD